MHWGRRVCQISHARRPCRGNQLLDPHVLKIQVVSRNRRPCRGNPFLDPHLLKIQVCVSGSRRPCRGNPFYKLLVASQCSCRGFFLAEKSVPGIWEPQIVENASCCVRKQAPLPGESILQAFSSRRGFCCCQKVRSRLFLVQTRTK